MPEIHERHSRVSVGMAGSEMEFSRVSMELKGGMAIPDFEDFSLKRTIANWSWGYFGGLMLWLCCLYAFFAAYFTMLLEIALAIRGSNFIVLSQEEEDFKMDYDVTNPTPWVAALQGVPVTPIP